MFNGILKSLESVVNKRRHKYSERRQLCIIIILFRIPTRFKNLVFYLSDVLSSSRHATTSKSNFDCMVYDRQHTDVYTDTDDYLQAVVKQSPMSCWRLRVCSSWRHAQSISAWKPLSVVRSNRSLRVPSLWVQPRESCRRRIASARVCSMVL